MKKRTAIFRGCAALMALLMLVTSAAITLTFKYDGVINDVLGISTTKIIDTGEVVETDYYTSEYGTDYYNAQAALQLELDASIENIKQYKEGVVLLRNENSALPFSASSRVTLFGNASIHGKYSTSTISTIETVTIPSALQQALGTDNVNTVLVDNVYSSMSSTSGLQVVEAEIGEVKKYANTWQNDYNDAAIVVLTRFGTGEDNDVPFYTEDGRHFLNLHKNEEDLVAYLKEQKDAGVFKKIIAILNTDYMMELDWLEKYDIDACLLGGSSGAVGFTGLASILIGETNPSGHLTDTMAYNSLSSPAVINAAENTPVWDNLDEVLATCADSTNNGINLDEFVVYAEGIYVGYKYYETRYEDVVTGAGGADSAIGSSTGGAWNYAEEVQYPFGYGLSYTTFQQELLDVTFDYDAKAYNVTVKVTNTGSVPGKSVAEVYAQTPYGSYEKENGVEASAIILGGFSKTQELAPGASETLSVSVPAIFLAKYDENNAKTYIMSEGDYYLSLGDNAHDALNNILAAKGYSSVDGMTSDGNAAKTYRWHQDELDTQTYSTSIYSDTAVTNQFDNADPSYYGIPCTYLSRSDWEGTYPAETFTMAATAEMMTDLDLAWYETPEDAPAVSDFTQGADNGLSFIDMRLVPWDDEETWNRFLDEFTVEELASMLNDSRGTPALDRLGVPAQNHNDDGNNGTVLLALGVKSLNWVRESTTARTWNPERYTERGRLRGIEAAFGGINELWYGGGNIHRTPFGGRTDQYFSEDGNMGYWVGYYEATAMQEAGVNYAIKHVVMNDQEVGRESLATFANEQSIREEYLRNCEGAMAAGNAQGAMIAFNRIGVVACEVNRALLTGIFRDEWGFLGHLTTDGFTSGVAYKAHFREKMVAGIDYVCLDPNETSDAILAAINDGDGYLLQCLRLAVKRNLYTSLRTIAANGLSSTSRIVTIVPWWETTLLAANLLFALGFVAFTACTVVDVVRKPKLVIKKG